MQKGYRYYRTEPPGKNFHPDFKPDLTPEQMLKLGVFGRRYLRDCRMSSLQNGLRMRNFILKVYPDTVLISIFSKLMHHNH